MDDSELASKQNISAPLISNNEKDLPDLMPRIQEMGWAHQYHVFRQGYMNWRQGKHRGAAGEITHEGFEKAENLLLTYWYPSVKQWELRRTTSYWITVFFLEGSFLFTLTGFVGAIQAVRPDLIGDLLPALTAQATFAGHLWYMGGTYLMVFAVVNLKREEVNMNPFHFRDAFEHMDRIKLHRITYVIATSYWWGALLYFICTGAALFEEHLDQHPRASYWLITMPTFVGGWLFALGSCFEVIENELWRCQCATYQFWAVISNLLGGILFGVSGSEFLFDGLPAWVSPLGFGVGAALYALNSVIALFMWKDEQFGLSYIAQLNKLSQLSENGQKNTADLGSARQADDPSLPQQKSKRKKHAFSVRGIIMVLCVSFFSAVSEVNFILSFYNEEGTSQYVNGAYSHTISFLLFQMILVLQSAVVRLPPHQPYRCLLIMARFLSLIMGIKMCYNSWDMYTYHFAFESKMAAASWKHSTAVPFGV